MRRLRRRRATIIGASAILLWSGMVGCIRLVTESFGTTLGNAMVYTLAAALLWVVRRPRSLRTFPRRYLVLGGTFFLVYEISIGFSIGLAADAQQAIEVSIVNYLWPTFAVLLTAALSGVRRRRRSWLLIPGALVATTGIALAISGDAGLDPAAIAAHVASDPLPYALAFIGAAVWAVYSVCISRLARGHDGITVFFTATAATLWIVHLLSGSPAAPAPSAAGAAAVVAAAILIAAGYTCWNIGIMHGDMRTLSTASYAAPILSSVVGALLLGTALAAPFWQGVVLVAAGSLIGWWSTSAPTRKAGDLPASWKNTDRIEGALSHGKAEEHAQ